MMKRPLAALLASSTLMFGGMATADAHGDRHEWKHDRHRYHSHRPSRVYVAPPIAYYPGYVAPTVVYTPPPVIYPAPVYYERSYSRPGITISVPPLFVGF